MKKLNINLAASFFSIAVFFQVHGYAQVIDDFSLKNTDDNSVSLTSYSSKKAIAVIFTGNHCVYSKKYEDRIIALFNKYSAKGIQILLINSNNPGASEEENAELMQARAKEKGYSFPYLQDSDSKVAKQFGARKNPEAFLLIPEGGKFNVIYHGNIDDNALMADKVTKKYLEDAIERTLNGQKPETAGSETVGCVIKEM